MKLPRIFKSPSEPEVEYDPVVPEGWVVQVRHQEMSYASQWEYCAFPPDHIRELSGKASYYGTGYWTKHAAKIAAIDMAETVERQYRNKNVEWETV